MIAGTAFDIVAVQDAWPRYRVRARRAGAPAETLHEFLQQCARGEALCLEGPDGMVIMSASLNSSGTICAEVLLAVSRGRLGAFERCEPDLLAIARDMGAGELVFRTYRPGWRALLGPQWREQDGAFRRST